MTRRIKREAIACCESAASTPPAQRHTEDVAGCSPRQKRTKFRETRHPVFRGVRRRGRVPGRRGCRLWLGTFAAAEDAAVLALRGGAPCLNFPDSAWLLDVPVPVPPRADAAGVRRAVAVAVDGFLRARADAEDAMSATSEPSSAANDVDGAATETEASSSSCSSSSSSSSSYGSDDAREASPFELDMLSDMGAGLYYASLAQGLLMEPPPLDAPFADDSDCDCDCDLAGVELWSY